MNFEKYINLYKQHLISEKNLSINTIKSYEIDLKQFFDQSISKKDLNISIDELVSKVKGWVIIHDVNGMTQIHVID